MGKNSSCIRWFLIATAALPLLAGCSFNYSEAEVTEELDQFLPDTVLINLKHIQVKKDKNTIILKAGKAENYENQHKTILENLTFEEIDLENQLITEGQAARAVYFTDTENAEITGDIKVHSRTEGVKISADSLIWEKAPKQLKTVPDGLVILEKDDGSYVKGKNFKADLRRKEISFKNRVEGTYTQAEDESKQ